MHTLTVVLLPRSTSDLREAAANLFRPHRVDWDDDTRPWRLDYWSLGDENIKDEFTARALGLSTDNEDDEDLCGNVCFVSRLSPDFIPGAVVTPEGTWCDLLDHGWRLVDGDTPANRDAEAQWAQQVKQLFAMYVNYIAVEFDTHS